jgi:similar to stage IV sporulation protein
MQMAEEEGSVHISLDFGKRRIKLYAKGSMMAAGCDKITKYKSLTLPGGFLLPITVVTERMTWRATTSQQRTAEQAYEEGKAELLALLQQQMTESGSVTETRFAAAQQGDYLLVTLRAECLEQIGQQVLLPKE